MDSSWTQGFKSIYRREPVTSFMATAGAVNAAIGGASAHWMLMSLGLGTVGMAIALRWRHLQTRKANLMVSRGSVYVLPSSASGPTLPLLSVPKKKPPEQ